MGDRLRVAVGRPVGEAGVLAQHLVAAEGQGRAATLADHDEVRLLSLPAQLPFERERPPDDLRVEGAGEAAVAGERHHGHLLDLLALLQQRQSADGSARAPDAGDQLAHRLGVGPHRLDPGLRTAKPGGGDELHRLRDLARVLD